MTDAAPPDQKKTVKAIKFAIVVHEFGRYKGHGGISTYVEHLVDALIRYTAIEVYVYSFAIGKYTKNTRLKVVKIPDLDLKGANFVSERLEKLNPTFVEVADYGGLCSQYLLRRELALSKRNFPVIVNHHTGSKEIWEWGTQTRFADVSLNKSFRGTALNEDTQNRFASAHVASSNFLASYLKRRYGYSDIEVLYYCYPISSTGTSGATVSSDGTLRLLSMTRFELRKRLDLLVESCCELLREGLKLQVTLVGNSTPDFRTGIQTRDSVFRMIPCELRKYFHFYDFLYPDEIASQISQSDLFVIPSPRENFPIAVLDIIKRGLPVAASRSSGVPDFMRGDLTLTFKAADVTSIGEMLRRAVKLKGDGLKVYHEQQASELTKMVDPESSLARRINFFSRVEPSNPIKPNSEQRVVLLLPPGSPIQVEHLGKYKDTRVIASSDYFPDSVDEETLFLYFPLFAQPQAIEFMLEIARRANRMTHEELISFAPHTSEGHDINIIQRVRKAFPLIGRFQLKGPAPRHYTMGDFVGDRIYEAKKLYYLYHSEATCNDLTLEVSARLDQRISPFEYED